MSIDTIMDKEDVAHIYIEREYDYISRILLSHKKNEIMPFAATLMNLEIIILSEMSQKEKDKYRMILLICRI